MEFFENKLSPCFERSTSRDPVLVKDKPSPLRIIKRCRNNSRQRALKSNSADAGVDDSPRDSLQDCEPPRVYRLPRRRPKIVSEKSTGHTRRGAIGQRQSSQDSCFEHSFASRRENDDIPGQDYSPELPTLYRYSLKMRRLRRKRPALKTNLENRDGDRITSTCTLPMEHSHTWLDGSSRASSRCTYHGQRDSHNLAELPFLPKPLLAEETSLVLSPHINVIPETMSMRAGQQHLWAAIEVCGRLFPANNRPENGRVSCSDKGWYHVYFSIFLVQVESWDTHTTENIEL